MLSLSHPIPRLRSLQCKWTVPLYTKGFLLQAPESLGLWVFSGLCTSQIWSMGKCSQKLLPMRGRSWWINTPASPTLTGTILESVLHSFLEAPQCAPAPCSEWYPAHSHILCWLSSLLVSLLHSALCLLEHFANEQLAPKPWSQGLPWREPELKCC